ncbi:hypothetical protein [Actinomadura formosensis]|uniref:hypothetical protein n=1 Tax=Actinomadura formosensis TaxID=60706 RepID=UPI00104101A3|nr:hypothetical protein [Actinomadura formosensis]
MASSQGSNRPLNIIWTCDSNEVEVEESFREVLAMLEGNWVDPRPKILPVRYNSSELNADYEQDVNVGLLLERAHLAFILPDQQGVLSTGCTELAAAAIDARVPLWVLLQGPYPSAALAQSFNALGDLDTYTLIGNTSKHGVPAVVWAALLRAALLAERGEFVTQSGANQGTPAGSRERAKELRGRIPKL